MSAPLLDDWTPAQRQAYRREVVAFRNRLDETGLFTDEALAGLIDRHPKGELDVVSMYHDETGKSIWAAGDWSALSGMELLAAVRAGKLWMNIRHPMESDPAYAPVFARLIQEFRQQSGGHLVLKAQGGILVSSPNAQVSYHCDRTDTMLWHVRGFKTMYVWPTADPFVTELDYERMILKEILENIPYNPEFEAHATAVPMSPGSSVSWPLHGPHRVSNGDSLCVSVTIEYSTLNSTLMNAVFLTNAVLRRRLGLELKSRTTPQALRPLYVLAAQALKPLAPKADAHRANGVQFDVDPGALNCVRWRHGFGPRTA